MKFLRIASPKLAQTDAITLGSDKTLFSEGWNLNPLRYQFASTPKSRQDSNLHIRVCCSNHLSYFDRNRKRESNPWPTGLVIEVAFNDSILVVITPTLWGYTETLIRFERKNFHRLGSKIRTCEPMFPKHRCIASA